MAELGQGTGPYQEPEISEEGLLLSRLKRIEANPTGVYAVHIFLSKLRSSNRKPHFLKIAARSFDILMENHEATVFPMHNADLVLICRNVPIDDADAAVDKVRASSMGTLRQYDVPAGPPRQGGGNMAGAAVI